MKNEDIEKDGAIMARAKELGMNFLEKLPKKIEENTISLISEEVAERNKIFPFESDVEKIKVAIIDPQNIEALNTLRFMSEKDEREIALYLVSEATFKELMKFYSSSSEIVDNAVKSVAGDIIFSDDKKQKKDSIDAKEEFIKDTPVAKLVQVIISHAIEGHASDIHIEPMEEGFRVRFRVDGVLHMSLTIPKEVGPVVVSRIKILSNLKIDEKRKPQDGRFRIIHEGKPIDFRVSTLPVINGEKMVMRILDKDNGVGNIESMGMIGSALEHVKMAIQESYGMILMTGPTGSGKSTTLYGLLKILNNEERNIITLEDPIEYNIEGLNQSQIKPEIGYTFASGLRTILRQDPNVIMVGEIRDSETAELAVHAALTGHLMFSTLHTNTAIGSISRMVDMGIEPFLLSSSLRLVMAQRLVRRICEKCKSEIEVSAVMQEKIMREIANIPKKELEKYGIDLSKKIVLFKGKGCDGCNETGLVGRLAIFEVVKITEAMKNIIIEKNGNEILITEERNKMGILTIRQDGILKMLKGMTILEEIERVTDSSIMEGE